MGRSVKKGPFTDGHLEKKVDTLNAANEQVLQELVFRGDSAKHVF